MFPKTLVIILAGCIIGVIGISASMMAAAGWATPGKYTGTSDASRAPSSTTDCYSFQTGCKNIHSPVPNSAMDSGAYLSGNYH